MFAVVFITFIHIIINAFEFLIIQDLISISYYISTACPLKFIHKILVLHK